MADTSPLAGLLDRASHVFSLAGQLGKSFYDVGQSKASLFDAAKWKEIAPAFEEYCSALLELPDTMRHPPYGFAGIAERLLEAAGIAREIRSNLKSDDGLKAKRARGKLAAVGQNSGDINPSRSAFTAYSQFWDRLNAIAEAGQREVEKAKRQDDPFEFVDQPAKGTEAAIGTTPQVPNADHQIDADLHALQERNRLKREQKRRQQGQLEASRQVNTAIFAFNSVSNRYSESEANGRGALRGELVDKALALVNQLRVCGRKSLLAVDMAGCERLHRSQVSKWWSMANEGNRSGLHSLLVELEKCDAEDLADVMKLMRWAADYRRDDLAALPRGATEAWDTTPNCVIPPGNAVVNARHDIPGLLNDVRPRAGEPLSSLEKSMNAGDLLKKLVDKGHGRSAAEWAIHQLVRDGLVTLEGAFIPPLPQVWQGSGAAISLSTAPRKYQPADFKEPDRWRKIVVRSSSALWERWRNEQIAAAIAEKHRQQRENEDAERHRRRRVHEILDGDIEHSAEGLRAFCKRLLRILLGHENLDMHLTLVATSADVIRRLWDEMQLIGDPLSDKPSLANTTEAEVFADSILKEGDKDAGALRTTLEQQINRVIRWCDAKASKPSGAGKEGRQNTNSRNSQSEGRKPDGDQSGMPPPKGEDVETSQADTPTRAQKLERLQPATRRAYFAFQFAESKAGRKLEDHEAFDLLREEGITKGTGDLGELADYELPSLETWQKHLGNARRALGEQKYSRRGKRARGKSIVHANEIEQLNPSDD